jgi:hypothetical protein
LFNNIHFLTTSARPTAKACPTTSLSNNTLVRKQLIQKQWFVQRPTTACQQQELDQLHTYNLPNNIIETKRSLSNNNNSLSDNIIEAKSS